MNMTHGFPPGGANAGCNDDEILCIKSEELDTESVFKPEDTYGTFEKHQLGNE